MIIVYYRPKLILNNKDILRIAFDSKEEYYEWWQWIARKVRKKFFVKEVDSIDFKPDFVRQVCISSKHSSFMELIPIRIKKNLYAWDLFCVISEDKVIYGISGSYKVCKMKRQNIIDIREPLLSGVYTKDKKGISKIIGLEGVVKWV